MVARFTTALTSPRGQRWLLLLVAVESGALLAVLVVPAVLSGTFGTLGRTGLLLTAAAFAVSVLVLPAASWLARLRITRWLASDSSGFVFLMRLAACVVVGLVGFVVYKTLLDGLASTAGSVNPYSGMSKPAREADIGTLIVGLGLLAAWPVCMYLFVLGQAGAVALAITSLRRLRR